MKIFNIITLLLSLVSMTAHAESLDRDHLPSAEEKAEVQTFSLTNEPPRNLKKMCRFTWEVKDKNGEIKESVLIAPCSQATFEQMKKEQK